MTLFAVARMVVAVEAAAVSVLLLLLLLGLVAVEPVVAAVAAKET